MIPDAPANSLPELYQLQRRLQENRELLPEMRRGAIRRAKWALLGAFAWGLGVWSLGRNYDSAPPDGFLYGAAWAIWLLQCLKHIKQAWAEIQEFQGLDNESRRVLAEINKAIQERVKNDAPS